jgi:GT2 family glycosyltransferase
MTYSNPASIIIPTGERIDALRECLQSLEQHAPNVETIVIGEKKDSATRQFLRDQFPTVKYLESDESSAVVKRNLGIAHSSNEILVFVDDDVVVEGKWLDNLLRHYADNTVGGVGGRVQIPGIDRSTSNFKTGVIEDGFVIGNWNPAISRPVEVEHLIGCNMSLRKAPVMKLGGFDNFFRSCNYREETDLCLRIRQLGHRIMFDPDAALVHKALGRKRQGERWVFYYLRNTLYLYLKYQTRRGDSLVRFLRRLIAPPSDYASLSGVKVRLNPITPLVVATGMVAGLLGYIGHQYGQPRRFNRHDQLLQGNKTGRGVSQRSTNRSR